MQVLRRMKADAALLIALADIGGVWPVARVTASLTEVADTALRIGVRRLLADAAKSGKFRLSDAKNPESGSGYMVLAMGKMGAHELNYSSDIDLMVFFNAATPALTDGAEATPIFTRLTRELVKLLQERTARRLCFSRRPAIAARSIFDTDCNIDGRGARLLRKQGPDLGACRADQGARLCRRP